MDRKTMISAAPPDTHRPYGEGYDDGLRDATTGAPAAYAKPRSSNASAYRFGYADGYNDGVVRKINERYEAAKERRVTIGL